MNKFILHTVLFLSLFGLMNNADAQRVGAITDRQKILLGEQIQLELRLEGLPTDRIAVGQWFNIPDTFNHLEVVSRSKIDTIDVNGTHTYTQQIMITGFDSGRWELPALSVQLINTSSNRSNTLQTQPILIDVLPVDVSAMEDYHPIKDILEVKPGWDWWLWIGIALAVVITVLIILWLTEKRKNRKPKKEKFAMTALQEALHSLESLRSKTDFNDRDFYLSLENIYRRFFTRQLDFDAMNTTPDELIIRLKVNIQSIEQQTAFFQLVRLIAAVKYAKFNPAVAERINALQITETTIKQIDQSHGGQK